MGTFVCQTGKQGTTTSHGFINEQKNNCQRGWTETMGRVGTFGVP